MLKTIIIAEKPSVANKLASVIREPGVTVISARGHILELDFGSGSRGNWMYPLIEPPDSLKLSPSSSARSVLDNIVSHAKDADVLVSATDLDREGSAIFYEILLWLRKLNPSYAPQLKRMEISALTTSEIKKAWASLKEYDWGRSYAGFSRSIQDMEWGVNLTRAMTVAGRSGLRSGGRVQSPMLKLIADRDKEIAAFKPKPYWVLTITVKAGSETFDMAYDGRIDSESALKAIQAAVPPKTALSLTVASKDQRTAPPGPFNGTTLQIEGNRALGFTAKEIADRGSGLAQKLYQSGLVSYIGTDSEKYPKDWAAKDWAAMKSNLQVWVNKPLLAKDTGVNGRSDDPAHPCIHPVALPVPSQTGPMSAKERALYDLIVRRCACGFMPDFVEAVKTVKAVASPSYPFKAVGKTVISNGWREVYPFIKTQEKPLPNVKSRDVVTVVKSRVQKKETQPPVKYNIISLIAQCEKMSLGTKNTRPGIIEKLIERGYLEASPGKKSTLSIAPSGKSIVDVLDKYAPVATGEQLSEMFNTEMATMEKSGAEADFRKGNDNLLIALSGIMVAFKKNESSIGQELSGIVTGPKVVCPECGEEMRQKKASTGSMFYGCSAYPKCKTAFFYQESETVMKDTKCSCGLPLVSGKIRGEDFVRCLAGCPKSPLRCEGCDTSMRVSASRRDGGLYARCPKCGSYNSKLILT